MPLSPTADSNFRGFFAICDMNVLSMVCVEGIIFVIFYNFSR